MRTASITILATLVLALAAPLPAQPPSPKPGPEHELFKAYEGVWDATIHEKEGTNKGTMAYKVGLGGLWLLEHFETEFGGSKFEGRGAMSYDAGKKKYTGVWIDSMSTNPMTIEGTYDKAKKTMTSVGNAVGPDGKMMKLTMVTQHVDADNMTFTMSAPGEDGKTFEMMKITYKRKAK